MMMDGKRSELYREKESERFWVETLVEEEEEEEAKPLNLEAGEDRRDRRVLVEAEVIWRVFLAQLAAIAMPCALHKGLSLNTPGC